MAVGPVCSLVSHSLTRPVIRFVAVLLLYVFDLAPDRVVHCSEQLVAMQPNRLQLRDGVGEVHLGEVAGELVVHVAFDLVHLRPEMIRVLIRLLQVS